MLTDRSFRQLGIVLAGLGLILFVGGGALLLLVLSAADRMRGGLGVQIFVFGIVGMIPTMGLTVIFAGVWQYVFCKSNPWLVWGFVSMAGAVLVIGTIAKYVL